MHEFLVEKEKYDAWDIHAELLACILDALTGIRAQLVAGVPTATPQNLKNFGTVGNIPRTERPDWFEKENQPKKQERVVSLRELGKFINTSL